MASSTGKMESGAGNDWTILAASSTISIRDHVKVRLQEGSPDETLHSIVEAIDQAGQHSVDLIELTTSITVSRFVEQNWASRQFKQRYALLDGASGFAKELLSAWHRKATMTFRDIGGDRNRSPAQTIDEEPMAANDFFRPVTDRVCEVDQLQLEESFSRATANGCSSKKEGERKVESRPRKGC